MNRSFVLIGILIVNSMMAQPVTITGSAPGAEGKQIKLATWSDMITMVEKSVAQTTIDSNGNFSLTFEIPATIFVTFSIDFHVADLFIQPGKSYELRITPMTYNDNLEVNPLIFSQNLEMEMINPGMNELNIWIQNYNAKYDQYLVDHFNKLYLERSKPVLDTFKRTVNSLFTGVDLPYFQQYIAYKTAGLEQVSKALSQAQLAEKYFIDRPILYDNVEYMYFFNSFFKKYLTATSGVLRKIDLIPQINGPEPYTRLMKTLTNDTLLKNEQLREMVLLKGLFELFYETSNLQDRIIEVIRQIRQECKYEQNTVIADNMITRMTHLRPGTPAPGFTLKTDLETMVALKDLRGKPVVLNFWTTYCQGCLSEMEILSQLYNTYHDDIEFVSISADKFWIKMHYFVKLKPNYQWNMLHIGDEMGLLKDYEVRTYPLFVLIDRDGNIASYPALLPSEGLEKEIIRLVNH